MPSINYSENLCATNHEVFNKRTITAISLILIVSFTLKLLVNFYYHALTWDLNRYGYSEFLINYQGGFVRRGLLGELLFYLYQFVSFPIHESILCFSYLVFIGVVIYFFHRFKTQKINWWLLLSPLFLNFTIYIVRKDYLLYAILIVILNLLRSSSHAIIKKTIACTLILFALFIHEAFLFWGFVIYALILLTDKRHKALNYLLVIIPIISSIIILFSKGNQEISQLIVSSWNSILPNSPLVIQHHNSIGAIGWDTLLTFIFHLKLNVSGALGGGGIILIPLLLITAYYLFTNYVILFSNENLKIKTMRRKEISLLFPVLCITLIPMLTILSCDTGRIFQYATITTFSAILILPSKRILSIFPQWYNSIIDKINYWIDDMFPPTKTSLLFILIIIGISPASFNLNSSWCESVVGSIISNCLRIGVKLFKIMFL